MLFCRINEEGINVKFSKKNLEKNIVIIWKKLLKMQVIKLMLIKIQQVAMIQLSVVLPVDYYQ